MARIVPARPKATHAGERRLVEVLEEALDDSFLVLQRRPDDKKLVVAHPQGYLVVLVPLFGAEWRWDVDAEVFATPDGDEVDVLELLTEEAASLQKAVGNAEVRGRLLFMDLERAASGAQQPPDKVLFLDDLGSGKLLEDMKSSVGSGKEGARSPDLNGLLRSVAPQAEPFVPGKVTAAQEKWRATRGKMSSEDPGAAVNSAGAGSEREPLETQPGKPASPIQQVVPVAEPKPTSRNSKALMRMVEYCVAAVARDKPIFVAGVQVRPDDVADPQFLLPAILIAAADQWVPVVCGKGRKGGFHIKLKSNPDALLGLEVVEITPSAPFLFFIPVTHLIRSSEQDGELGLDGAVVSFARWLSKNKLDAELVEDIDIRVALSVMQ